FPQNGRGAFKSAPQISPLVRREVPGATFHIVGAAPSPSVRALTSRPGVALSADLPDLRESLSKSHVYVCAIRHGAGVKNKILEALALRLPVVCYPEPTAGIDCTPGTHLLVADSRVQFARHVVALLKDPGLCARLGDAGRRLMEQSYSWDARARAYERLYAEIREERGFRARTTVSSPGEESARWCAWMVGGWSRSARRTLCFRWTESSCFLSSRGMGAAKRPTTWPAKSPATSDPLCGAYPLDRISDIEKHNE